MRDVVEILGVRGVSFFNYVPVVLMFTVGRSDGREL